MWGRRGRYAWRGSAVQIVRMSVADSCARSYDVVRHVALPALRRTTGRDGALLGLPTIVDHLFDLHPFSARPGGRSRVLRPRRSPPAADGPRAARLLGAEGRDGRTREPASEPGRGAAPAARRTFDRPGVP